MDRDGFACSGSSVVAAFERMQRFHGRRPLVVTALRNAWPAIRDFKISRIPFLQSRISYPGTRIPSPAASFHLLEISRFPTVVQRGFGRAVEPEDGEISFAGHRGLPVTFLIRLGPQRVTGHREWGNCRIARASC
jgi:hypothetical protein